MRKLIRDYFFILLNKRLSCIDDCFFAYILLNSQYDNTVCYLVYLVVSSHIKKRRYHDEVYTMFNIVHCIDRTVLWAVLCWA